MLIWRRSVSDGMRVLMGVSSSSKEAAERCRWWSSWMLVLAFVPIAVLYLVWLPLTCMGKIKTMELEEDAYI